MYDGACSGELTETRARVRWSDRSSESDLKRPVVPEKEMPIDAVSWGQVSASRSRRVYPQQTGAICISFSPQNSAVSSPIRTIESSNVLARSVALQNTNYCPRATPSHPLSNTKRNCKSRPVVGRCAESPLFPPRKVKFPSRRGSLSARRRRRPEDVVYLVGAAWSF